MSPAALAALVLHHRQPEVGDSFLISGRQECEALKLIDKGQLTPMGRFHHEKLCKLHVLIEGEKK